MKPSTFLTGIAGGAASALLFAAVTGGGALAMPLFLLGALPIAIASIGWGTLSGVVAAAFAAGFLGFLTTTDAGVLHALAIGLPMAAYGHLVGLARPSGRGEALEWYPLARVMTTMVWLTAASLTAAGLFIGFDVDEIAREGADMLTAMASSGAGGADMPDRDSLMAMMRLYMRILPFALSLFWVAVMAANLWLGSRVVRLSGRLRRPEESIAEAVDLPYAFAAVLVLALLLAAVDGPVGLIAGTVAGSSLMGFAMIGLATLHIYLRGNPAAGMILALTYATTFVISLPLVPLALAGLLDRPLGLRRRRLEEQKRGGSRPPT